MLADRFQELERLFHDAMRLPEGERVGVIDSCIADDPELGRELQAMVETASGDAATSAEFDALFRVPAGSTAPIAVPGYEIGEVVGRGGQGTVYTAVQLATGRRVAVKVLHTALEAPGALQRFEREVGTIARLDHPAIIGVVDSGRTVDGRAYLAMDFVAGAPLDVHCNQAGLRTEGVLALFLDVCDAVEHAHRKGVLHRDLKPSNIRVDADGRVHLLDFGLARTFVEDTLDTSRTGRLLGTVAYMSPEQVRGGDRAIDVRVDVYALGVLLYRLLTGRFPYPVDGDLVETLRHVCETPPARTTGSSRRTDPELEAVLRNALQKDVDARYATIAALSADLRRYLRGDPVEARVERRLYIARKLAWKHRRIVGAALLFVAVVCSALIVIARLYHEERDTRIRETAAKKLAEEERLEAVTVSRFLHRYVLAPASPMFEADRDISVREVVDRASAALPAEFREHPRIESALHNTIGLIYLNLGEYAQAEEHARAGLELCANNDFSNERTERHLQQLLAGALRERGEFDEAAALYAELRESVSRLPQDDLFRLSVTMGWGSLCQLRGDLAAAAAAYREVAEHSRASDRRQYWTARNDLAVVYALEREFERAEAELDACLEELRAEYGPEHPSVLTTRHNLAMVYEQTGRFAEALPLYEDLVRVRAEVCGPTHPNTLTTLDSLGACCVRLGRFEEAAVRLRAAFDGRAARLGERHPRTIDSACHLAQALGQLGRWQEAETMLRDAVARSEGTTASGVRARNDLGWLLLERQRFAEAAPILDEALRLSEAMDGPLHTRSLALLGNVALCARKQERLDEARALFEISLQRHREVYGPQGSATLIAELNLARCEDARGAFDAAAPLYDDALSNLGTALPPEHWLAGLARFYVGEHHAARGSLAKAEASLLEAHAILRRTFAADHGRVTRVVDALVALYEQRGDERNAAQWRAARGR